MSGVFNLDRRLSNYPLQGLERVPVDFLGYLQAKAYNIRSREINWLPYLKDKTISREECIFITLYQEAEDKEARDNILNFFELRSIGCFLNILKNISEVEVIQRVVIMIDDMLWDDITKVPRFYEASEKEDEPAWKPFFELLRHEDEFIRNVSSRIIAKLVTYQKPSLTDEDQEFFLKWLKENLQKDNKYIQSILRCLQRMFKHNDYRTGFLKVSGIESMLKLLSETDSHQTQYQLCFCIWLATYNPDLAENMNKLGAVPTMATVLGDSPAEYVKLPRVIMSAFRNLLEQPPHVSVRKQMAYVMVQHGVIRYMELLETKEHLFNDIEFADDFEAVSKALQDCIKEMSSYVEYCMELKSGKLDWSIVHTSQKFWKENAHRFNEHKYEVIKELLNILSTSKEPTVLSVALHDLGEYMRNYVRGRRVIEELNGKELLMELLVHEDSNVKYNALRAIQILMLSNSHLLDLLDMATKPFVRYSNEITVVE